MVIYPSRTTWTTGLLAAVVSWLNIAMACAAETNGAPLLTSAQMKQGYVAFQHHTLHLLESSDVPVSEDISEIAERKKITCTLARGEYEAVQIGVHAVAPDIKQVRLTVESDLEVRVFRRIDEKVHSLLDTYVNPIPPDIRPALLDESDEIASVKQATTEPFWLTFHAPPEASPGLHRGKIRIVADRGEGKSAIELDLEVTVYPFVLERARIAYWPFFYFKFADNMGLPEWVIEDKRWIESIYRDMAEHSHTSVSFFGYPGPGIDLTGELPPPENPYTSFLLPLAKKTGLISPDVPVIFFVANTGPPPSRGGPSIEQQNLAMNWMHDECRRQGWPELVGYGQDEPGYPSHHSPSLEEENGALRQISKRLATAMCARAAYGLGDFFDIWVMESGSITPELAAEAERLGAQIWTYSGGGTATQPLRSRYFAGLFVWAKKARGHTTWHHYAQTGYKMIWMRKGDESPMPSVGWETRRDGIDDYRYFQMLEDRIAANRDSLVAAAAGGWLEGLRTRITTEPNKVDLGNPLTAEEYQWIRAKAADYIQQLPSPPPGSRKPVQVTHLKDEARLFRGRSVQDCIRALQGDDLATRRAAALALMERGAEAAPAAAALVEQLSIAEVRIPALRALEKIGTPAAWAVPKIAALSSHPDAFVRLGATFALREMGPAATEALQAAVLDEFPHLAEAAGQGLSQLGGQAFSVPLVIKLLDMSAVQQLVALRAITQLGPDASAAVPKLLEQWPDKKLWHRDMEWLDAFGAIGPPYASDAVPIIDQRMPQFDPVTKAKAYYALCRLRGIPQDFDGLVKLLDSPETGSKSQQGKLSSAYYLFLLGPVARNAVRDVERMLQEGKHEQGVIDLLRGFVKKAGE